MKISSRGPMASFMLVLVALLGGSAFAADTLETRSDNSRESTTQITIIESSCSPGESCYSDDDKVGLLQAKISVGSDSDGPPAHFANGAGADKRPDEQAILALISRKEDKQLPPPQMSSTQTTQPSGSAGSASFASSAAVSKTADKTKYYFSWKKGTFCPKDAVIGSKSECVAAAKALGVKLFHGGAYSVTSGFMQAGCQHNGDVVHWNRDLNYRTSGGYFGYFVGICKACDCSCHGDHYVPDDRNDPPNDCWIKDIGYDKPCCPIADGFCKLMPELHKVPVQFFHSPLPASEDGSAGYSFYSYIYSLFREPYPMQWQMGIAHSWLQLSPHIGQSESTCFCNPQGSFGKEGCCGWNDKCAGLANSIEGGAGYWRDTLPTTRVKWRLGASAACHGAYARSLGWDPKKHGCDKMNVVQITNQIVVPPDGFSFEAEGMLGQAWVDMPFGKTHAKDHRHFWTLVFDSAEFSGPVVYILPEFFHDNREKGWESESADLMDLSNVQDPRGFMMNGYAFEIQSGPAFKGSGGDWKLPSLAVPYQDDVAMIGGWQRAYAPGGIAVPLEEALETGSFDASKLMVHIRNPDLITKANKYYLSRSFPAKFKLPEGNEFEFGRWSTVLEGENYKWTLQIPGCNGTGLCNWPQYISKDMKPILESHASADLRHSPKFLKKFRSSFQGPTKDSNRYDALTVDYGTCIHSPGPAKDRLYCARTLSPSWIAWKWYKFIDQPSLQSLGLTTKEKAFMQARIEKLHQKVGRKSNWLKPDGAQKYGMAQFDSSIDVTPPAGMKHGYVPVVLYEGLDKPSGCSETVQGSHDTSSDVATDKFGKGKCAYSPRKNIGIAKHETTVKTTTPDACCCKCAATSKEGTACAGYVWMTSGMCWLKFNNVPLTLLDDDDDDVVAGLNPDFKPPSFMTAPFK